MKQSKILIIGPTPPPYNGMSVVTDIILSSGIKEDFKIIHLDTADRRPLSNTGKFDFINIFLAIKHFFQFIYLCVRHKPDLIYLPIAQNIAGYLRDSLFLIPCRILGIKTLIHLHGSYFKDFYDKVNKPMKKLIDFTLGKISGAIVLGNCLKYIFKKWLPEEKIFVVPNGIEDKFGNETVKRNSGVFSILFLGTLCKEKGIFEILKIIPEIVKRYNKVKFIFAGEWFRDSEKEEAMKYIETHQIRPYVNFVGVVSGEKKREILINSDLLLLPTYYPFEGQPLVILEAMSAGLPVISTNKGAIGETISNGDNGFLVGIGNTEQLVEKVGELISNRELYERMETRSREIYLEKFTKEKFIQNLTNVFNKTIS